MHLFVVARITGLFAILFSATLCAPIIVALVYGESGIASFLYPMLGSLSFALLLLLIGVRGSKSLGVRDGFLVVALFWLIVSVLGAWPLILGAGLSPVDALFESVSGFTTTGATVITGLDDMPRSLLFYRQQIQWLGGMGVIVLGLAVIPLLGIGGMQLYRAEVPGPMKDEKLTPRLASTAQTLWILYLGLTVACALGYWAAGMNAFDAIAHSLSTVSTGGFSTHDDSLGFFQSPAIEWVAILFMLLAAINFGVHFAVWIKRDARLYLRDPEVGAFLLFVVFVVLLAGGVLWAERVYATPAGALEDATFEVVSLVTSTGFGIVDYSHWPDFLPVLMILISFVGGCGGSTAGGIKVVRVMLLMKHGVLEVQRLVHPRALQRLRLGRRVIDPRLIQSVWGYFAVYIATFVLCGLLMIHSGLDTVSAFTAVATSINNLGPGLGEVAYNFQSVSDLGKLISIVAMLLGRLEIFTFLVLLTPSFWRN